jgi:hypothetical protein
MKNLRVIPIDKPSRLWINTINGELVLDKEPNELHAQHIYITSDEEIKEGEWCYYENGDLKGIHKVINGRRPKTMFLKKIILTTDQELIKDGVQAIDDEFLEWFVKNPSCEEIEVKPYHILYYLMSKTPLVGYRIIIPKEESKQGGVFDNAITVIDVKASKQNCEDMLGLFDLDLQLPPKQETLEEVAERLHPEEWDWREREIFIAGAKWQQEQMEKLKDFDTWKQWKNETLS